MNIKNFNQGDLIVRTSPGKKQEERENETLGISTLVTIYEDTSYIGEPMKFLDVCNGMIYVERIGRPYDNGSTKKEFGLHIFKEGWDYFVVPSGYTMQDFETRKII